MNQFSHPISIPKQLHTFLSIDFSKKRVYISHKQGNKISENERKKNKKQVLYSRGGIKMTPGSMR